MGYLTNFIVYTLAMVGVIVVALLVFKNATSVGGGHTSKHLKVIDTLSLGQRKMLYIVSTGNEKFLIAGDVDKTSLISKLDFLDDVSEKESLSKENNSYISSFKRTFENFPKTTFEQKDKNEVPFSTNFSMGKSKNNVMKNIAERMR